MVFNPFISLVLLHYWQEIFAVYVLLGLVYFVALSIYNDQFKAWFEALETVALTFVAILLWPICIILSIYFKHKNKY